MAHTFTLAEFADAETPQTLGQQLLLQNAPTPPVSLLFFRNGVLQAQGSDYQLTGHLLTLTVPPEAADVFLAYYRF